MTLDPKLFRLLLLGLLIMLGLSLLLVTAVELVDAFVDEDVETPSLLSDTAKALLPTLVALAVGSRAEEDAPPTPVTVVNAPSQPVPVDDSAPLPQDPMGGLTVIE